MAKSRSAKETKTIVKRSGSGFSGEADYVVEVKPEICVDHDEKNYYIEINLPGVRKEHIDLSIGEQSICIQAARSDEATTYIGCFSLAHKMNKNKAKARFESGLLSIHVPLKETLSGRQIIIQ